MTNTMPRVGLDVHASQTHLFSLDLATGEIQRLRIEGPPEGVLKHLEGFGPNMLAVYEAGPTGYGLARKASERGLRVKIAAPGLIPRAPGDRVKTDRRDAERLARLLAAGELSFVNVPSIEDERFRDLVRCREDLRGDLMRARHRLAKFLLRGGLRYEGQGSNWTQAHHKWLSALSFDDPASQVTFTDYLGAVEALTQRRGVLEQAIAEAARKSSHSEAIARLTCFRGIDILTAAGLAAEIGDFRRFEKPAQLAAYLGITPSERTSAETRRQGQITRAGSKHARRLLVEAAHHYSHPPAIGAKLRARQEGQDPRACEVAWRAQRRIHSRWQHLHVSRRMPSGKAVIACARELTGFIWEAAVMD